MEIKYNEEKYINLCLEKEREIVFKTIKEWKLLILFEVCLFVINCFTLYLAKLPNIIYIVYLSFCALLMSFQIYLLIRYQRLKKSKLLFMHSILSTLIVIFSFMFFVTVIVATEYFNESRPKVDIFMNVFLFTTIANMILLFASLYHHNQYMTLHENHGGQASKLQSAFISIGLLTWLLYRNLKKYPFILAIIYIGLINYAITYHLSLNIIRCIRLLKLNDLEYNINNEDIASM